VEVSAIELPGPEAWSPRLKPGRFALLKVADTGSGMPPEVLARIFEPYFSTREAGKGTGMGLTAARAIAARGGGDLRVESAVGRGTSATLYLPVWRESGAEDGAGVEQEARAPGTGT
jgi:signal transduction histidine kinase